MSDGKTRRRMNQREWECFEDGVKYERDRISKLLKDYDFSTIWRQIEWNPDGWEGFGSDDLITLIKGESKPFITTKQAEELTNEMLEE